MLEPNEQTHINSMVEGVFPTIQTTIVDSKVATALASKTFLEKVFLLHEEFAKPMDLIRVEGSRAICTILGRCRKLQ